MSTTTTVRVRTLTSQVGTSTSSQTQSKSSTHSIHVTASRPPITFKNFVSEIRWFNLGVVTITPLLSIYGLYTTEFRAPTVAFCVFMYVLNMIGITAGYHRLWSHRSYKASLPLQYFLALAGASSVQGSIRWWARGHRSHHRYTDTDLDPYSARKGLLWSHIGWMLIKPRITPGKADVRDLSQNKVIMWQRKHYFLIALVTGVLIPWFIPGYFWGDWRGGYFYAGFLRITIAHHSTFCVNSIAHWLGETSYDDKHTPRDHIITAILTLGEGYHNFHHQFPMDYRNAVQWYQFDPTKWFIALCERFGLATHLQRFPENEIRKGQLAMTLKKLKDEQDLIVWPTKSDDLPVISWETFKEESRTRPLVLVAGFIHDVSGFIDRHPGGRELLEKALGTDATPSFFGGVYEHSHAAHNLLSTMRVGVLHGGLEQVDQKSIAPGEKLYIAESKVPTR
ncbi:delta 9-fatty acid desaturase protein [Fomitiporia mediterranea MF3/22]|uniref:delta 9-fatty acid desaturase protein n=1 Tax=Fomitiporia mediterranea (strain MF3/22) TaxID=694068 RepID=UPI00044095E6|nr:delta 9-fatty acid desaturase protein [Fomitiporia mediterranea MF3/22]EJD00826.1 delta 9-fatty acid desaturase protein [Fomitiporia mediterranea MF3/22]